MTLNMQLICIYANFDFIFSSTNTSCNIWKYGKGAVNEER